ncbi:FadR family transcriptional regulator [Mariniphaga sediminis]|uniref:FadR family transcriptional regulator n=1 Tax=Mariniphaga sediminis TaxID=1628158 RepID=A0A399D0H5_9BACT|nr:FadR/GntR family transcriptional regulator [Mariniphaga sediminis]RIH64966.1 FadR family transcriptional regulator [Mariniphaga sediminis]
MKELHTTTLADQAEEKIIGYIKENHLVPGDALPNEMQFSEMMGISRNVVREAMSRLRMLGLIESRTKRGIIVTEPPLLNGFKKVLDPQLLSIETIKDMMGMRIALEVGITDFIFTNITDNDIKELYEIVARQKALGINSLSAEDEIKFHLKIYQIAGNQFILKFQELMHPIFSFSEQNHENYFKPISQRLKKENKIVTHADILEFIKKGDREGYRKAISMHLQPYLEFLYNYQHK